MEFLKTQVLAAYMVQRVQQREAIHATWYRDMTAIQIEENPRLIKHMAEAYARFQMPGNEIVPHLEAHAHEWMFAMGEDINRVKRDLLNLNNLVLHGNPELAGRLLVDMADLQGKKLGPFSAHHMNLALNRFGRVGGAGYGLIGEAAMQKVGLGELFDDTGSIPARIRGVLRTEVEKRLPL